MAWAIKLGHGSWKKRRASEPPVHNFPQRHPLQAFERLPPPSQPFPCPSNWPGPQLRQPGSLGKAQDKQILPDVAVVEEGREGKGGRRREGTGVLQFFGGKRGAIRNGWDPRGPPPTHTQGGGDPGRGTVTTMHKSSHGDAVLLTLQGFLGLLPQHLPVGPVPLSQDPQHRLSLLNLPLHYEPPCGLQEQTRPATGRVVGETVKPSLWMKGRGATPSEGPRGGWRGSGLRATLEIKMAEPGQRRRVILTHKTGRGCRER